MWDSSTIETNENLWLVLNFNLLTSNLLLISDTNSESLRWGEEEKAKQKNKQKQNKKMRVILLNDTHHQINMWIIS